VSHGIAGTIKLWAAGAVVLALTVGVYAQTYRSLPQALPVFESVEAQGATLAPATSATDPPLSSSPPEHAPAPAPAAANESEADDQAAVDQDAVAAAAPDAAPATEIERHDRQDDAGERTLMESAR
jgi:hypothetical protein